MKTQATASDPSLNISNKRIQPRLAYHLHLHRTVMRCSLAIQKNGLMTLSEDQERAMCILIHIFSEQLKDSAHEAESDYDRLLLAIAQIQCQSFFFFKLHSAIYEESLVSLHTISCHIIRSAKALDAKCSFLPVAPAYARFGVLLAAYTLLRLLKSPFARYLDSETRELFFEAIGMSRRLSKVGNDPADRHATALTQLYNSSRAFKKEDGSDYTVLRIRTRLSMSAAFDAIWWWKEEYHGEAGAFANNGHKAKTSNISTPSDTNNTYNYVPDETFAEFFDEQLLSLEEYGIATQLRDDFLGWPLSTSSGLH